MPILADTNPVLIPVQNGREYVLSVSGGSLTVKRALESGAWIAVDGSPVSDGSEVRLTTTSSTETIQVMASVGPLDYNFTPIS